jgi:3'(2'), 5'-bisphosphate nucleotidase
MRVRPPAHLGREVMVAVQAVARAAELVRSVERGAGAGGLAKADASPATVADFAAQAVVAAWLARSFPGDPLVAEEDSAALQGPQAEEQRARVVDLVTRLDSTIQADRVLRWIDRGQGSPSRRFWVLDPVDGTKGLIRGGQYAIALALIVDNLVRVAVVACPRLTLRARDASSGNHAARGGIGVAVRGEGAWWASSTRQGFVQLSVSSVADPARACVLRSREPAHTNGAMIERVLQALSTASSALPVDSQAKHILLAAGDADLMLRCPLDPRVHDAIWDQAPGSLLIEEAGGRVTDLAGQPLDFSTGRRLLRNEGLVASNGVLHEAVLAAVKRAA